MRIGTLLVSLLASLSCLSCKCFAENVHSSRLDIANTTEYSADSLNYPNDYNVDCKVILPETTNVTLNGKTFTGISKFDPTQEPIKIIPGTIELGTHTAITEISGKFYSAPLNEEYKAGKMYNGDELSTKLTVSPSGRVHIESNYFDDKYMYVCAKDFSIGNS